MTPLLHDRTQIWPHQWELLKSFDRRVLIDGGVGTGKTAACIIKVRMHCLMNPGQRIAICAQTLQQIIRVFKAEWDRQIDPSKYRYIGGVDQRIEMPDCDSVLSFVYLESSGGRAAEKRRGATFSGYYITQAETIRNANDYDELDERVRLFGPEPNAEQAERIMECRANDQPDAELEDAYGSAINGLGHSRYLRMFDTNPGSPHHWIHRRFIDKGSEEYAGRLAPRHIHVISTPETSRYGDDQFEQWRRELSPVEWMRKIEGKWVGNEGLAFPDFQMDTHVSDFDINPEWSFYWSVDFGFKNPTCVLLIGVDSDNRVRICDEYYIAGKDINIHAKALTTWNVDYPPISVVTDNSPGEYAILMRTFRDAGREARHQATKKPKDKERMDQCTPRIAIREDGTPGLLVHEQCRNFIREMGGLEWEKTSEGRADKEKLVDVNNHSTDAWMYWEATVGNRRYKP